MRISDEGIELIKSFEGCVLKVYLDAVGVKTCGFGHTGPEVNALAVGTPITLDMAYQMLRSDLARFERSVNKYDAVYHWTQNEFDALCSFAYNIGSIDELTAKGTRSKAVIADKILLYNKAKGKVLKGLTRRREAERAMFVKGNTHTNHKTLRPGSRGPEVAYLQHRLNELNVFGGTLEEDGIYGPLTTSAVVELQGYHREEGVKQDGICGPITWKYVDG